MTTAKFTVLFDFDGTLIDTNGLIMASLTHVFETRFDRKLTRGEMIPHMGKPLDEQMRILSGLSEVENLVAAYREHNLRHHDEMVRAFPGVEETLAVLRDEGIPMGIVTTKMRATTEKGLRYFGLADYFAAIVAIDDVKRPKPDPEPVRTAMERLGAEPGRTLMIGDSPADIESANRAGAISAAVAWSLKGEQVLRRHKPHHIIARMEDVPELVRRLEANGAISEG